MKNKPIQRRTLLLTSLGIASGLPLLQSCSRAETAENYENGNLNSNADNMTTGKKRLQLDPHPETIEPFALDPVDWKMRLSDEAYYVLREEGTERPGTSALNNEKRDGEYACAGCGLVLTTSEYKFDSGTGWPSFWQMSEDRVITKTDFKLVLPRTEYHCARCGGHQGHVFKDGPQPTGLRYCNNGIALTFIPA